MKNRGFTLLEIMVSIGVVGMIGISIWAATSQTAKARDIVGYTQENLHQARVAFAMISRDIGSTFLSYHYGVEPTHGTVFIGTDGGNEDSIDFASFSHNRRFFDADESDQAEISYYLADDKNNSSIVNLIRRESAVLDEEPTEGGQNLILVRNVTSFNVEYYDIVNKEWQDEWDTTQLTGDGTVLPVQVRVKLIVNERLGAGKLTGYYDKYREVTYGTQIPIPMRTPILAPYFSPGLPPWVN